MVTKCDGEASETCDGETCEDARKGGRDCECATVAGAPVLEDGDFVLRFRLYATSLCYYFQLCWERRYARNKMKLTWNPRAVYTSSADGSCVIFAGDFLTRNLKLVGGPRTRD